MPMLASPKYVTDLKCVCVCVSDCEFILLSRLPDKAARMFIQEDLSQQIQGMGLPDPWTNSAAWRALLAVSRPLASLSSTAETISKGLWCGVMLNHVESRGSITLASADPHVPPNIDPNYCSDRRDVEKLMWATRQCLKMLKGPEFRNKIEHVNFPEPLKQQPLDSVPDDLPDDVVEEHVRRLAKTTWHYSCSVRMGPADDESCACDPNLHVKGVSGLRCADASIMPFVVSANTNATSMMIGHKAADMIVQEHGLQEIPLSRL